MNLGGRRLSARIKDVHHLTFAPAKWIVHAERYAGKPAVCWKSSTEPKAVSRKKQCQEKRGDCGARRVSAASHDSIRTIGSNVVNGNARIMERCADQPVTMTRRGIFLGTHRSNTELRDTG